ncbi:hypothetical protein ABPG72_009893 [Tetrahymena utriculariae]
MITKKQISESNIINAFQNSHKYLVDYLNEKNNFFSKSDYSHVLFFRSNMTFIDTEIYESHYSYSFLEFLGINIEDAKNKIQVFSPYQVKNGENRLKNAITFLQIINSKQKYYSGLPYTITTKDGIQVDCTIDVDIITSQQNPSWMNSQDSFMMVINFNIDEQQKNKFSKHVIKCLPITLILAKNLLLKIKAFKKKFNWKFSYKNITLNPLIISMDETNQINKQ